MPAVVVTALLAFAIVMTGMLFLCGVCVVMLKLGGRAVAAEADEGAEMADPVLVAVLTAAAAEALGRPVLVHRVRMHRAPESDRWSRAGRLDIMISHRVGPRR
ncbi:MAG: hypothetical protein JNM38_00110 [Acidobacteria bacterium]|nr:hypothetical protein [Acidobacteriota bacterium]